jgi:hypothetical protein
MYLYMAGVADADVFSGTQLIQSAKTLTESTFSVEVANEEIRAGKGAKLYGRYFHTSAFKLELTDGMFNLDFIAANIGSVKTIGGKTLTLETVTATNANSLTVTGTPADFLGQGTIGWYSVAGSNDWTAITFSGQTATATGVVSGTTYCVKYNTVNSALEQVIVDADIVPNEVTVILKGDLFLGEKPNDPSSGSKVGYVEIVVPRFQPDGAMEFSMSMTGAATTPFKGQALATYDATASCSQSGYYAIINRVEDSANWYDGLTGLLVEDANIQLNATTTSATLVTYAIYKNAQPVIVSPSNLTYTISPATATHFSLSSNTISTAAGVTNGDSCNVQVKVKGTGLPTSVSSIMGIASVEYTA